MDDIAKGGLTQFWEIFTVISCALKDRLTLIQLSSGAVRSQIKNQGVAWYGCEAPLVGRRDMLGSMDR